MPRWTLGGGGGLLVPKGSCEIKEIIPFSLNIWTQNKAIKENLGVCIVSDQGND